MDLTERTTLLAIAHAAQALLTRLDTLYTDTFAQSGERAEREALRAALADLPTLAALNPPAAVCAAIQAYRTAHAITSENLVQVAAPGEVLWDAWRTAPHMPGDPDTSVVAVRYEEVFGAYYATAALAIEDLEVYYTD